MIVTNGKLDFLLKLYSSDFDEKKGTILFIAKELGSPDGNTRAFLKKLKDEKILFSVDVTEINGQLCDVYNLDKEALLGILKESPLFKKIYKVIYDKSKGMGIIDRKELVELYSKEEL